MMVYLLVMKFITRNSREETDCLHIPNLTLMLRQAPPPRRFSPQLAGQILPILQVQLECWVLQDSAPSNNLPWMCVPGAPGVGADPL